MSSIADRFVVVLDANVLFPFRKRDLLLTFFAAGLYRARWTKDILAEWHDSLLALRPELADIIQSQCNTMATQFPDALVDNYDELICALTLPDLKDRHVLAAAIRAGAQHIVTDNLKDFPDAELGKYDLEAVSADEFLFRTTELYGVDAIGEIERVRRKYTKPAYTRHEFVLDLRGKGLPKLASAYQRFVPLLDQRD